MCQCVYFCGETHDLESAIAELLSQKTGLGSFFFVGPRSNINILNQIAWQVAPVTAAYPDFGDEMETMRCFLDAYEISPVPR